MSGFKAAAERIDVLSVLFGVLVFLVVTMVMLAVYRWMIGPSANNRRLAANRLRRLARKGQADVYPFRRRIP